MHTAARHWGTTATVVGCIGVAFCEGFDLQVSLVGPKLGGALKAAGYGSSQLFADILPLVVLASVAGLWFARQASSMRTPERESPMTLEET